MGLRAVVGLGANLGDRLATMQAAVSAMARFARVERGSGVYASAPTGPPQPEFLNAAVLAHVPCAAEDLLDALLAIERALGRERREKWGPRTIDLDILWAGETLVDTPRLSVPHPHLAERAFAVRPLLDVVPGARDPRTGRPYVVPPGEVRVTPWALLPG